MSIAGQMQIDIFHGEYLRSSTSCPATLDAESHSEPDGCRRPTLSQWSRIHSSHKNVSTEWPHMNCIQQAKTHLGLIPSEWNQIVRRHTKEFRDLEDMAGSNGPRYLKVVHRIAVEDSWIGWAV